MESIEQFDNSDELLQLARWTYPDGVLSVYVNADPYAEPNAEGNAIDVRNRFRDLQKAVHGDTSRWSKDVSTHLEKLAPEVEDLARPRRSGRGRVYFAALGDDWRLTLKAQIPVPNRVVLDDGPFIHPLLEMLDEGRRAGVLVVSGDAARLYEWRLGRLRPLSTLDREVIEAPHERAGQIGGGPAGRFDTPVVEHRQDRTRELSARFLDGVAEAAAQIAGERHWERILVSGGEYWTRPLADAVHRSFGDAVIPDSRVLGGLGDAELADTVTDLLRSAHSSDEARLLDRLAERGHQSIALGVSEVAVALNAGRVAHLVYDPQVRYTGYIGNGGVLAGEAGTARVTDAAPDSRFTERLVERALETSARISPVEGAADGVLREARGCAALLRW